MYTISNRSLLFFPLYFYRDETLEALSDAQVVAPAALTADLHSQDHRNSFLYVFDYQTKFGDYAQVSNGDCCSGQPIDLARSSINGGRN